MALLMKNKEVVFIDAYHIIEELPCLSHLLGNCQH